MMKTKKYEEKNSLLRSYNTIKTPTKKQRKTINEKNKNLDQERWIPLRDRTNYKPKSAYVKSKNMKAKARK